MCTSYVCRQLDTFEAVIEALLGHNLSFVSLRFAALTKTISFLQLASSLSIATLNRLALNVLVQMGNTYTYIYIYIYIY